MTPVRPRALLFDWDNTLVDTWAAIHHALKVTFEAMGREPWTLEQTRQRVRRSAREAFPALFGTRAEEAAGIFYRAFERDHLQNLEAREGADALLQGLAGAGRYYLAVVSNKRGDRCGGAGARGFGAGARTGGVVRRRHRHRYGLRRQRRLPSGAAARRAARRGRVRARDAPDPCGRLHTAVGNCSRDLIWSWPGSVLVK